MVAAESIGSAGGVFVGRAFELDELQRALADALAGSGRLLLLCGEAGIGKTRLADELARLATQRGAQVVWGRCWESGGAPAFWPWVQILRACRRDLDPAILEPLWRTHAADLAELMPDTAPAQVAPTFPIAEPEQARFRLFDAVATVMRGLARHVPLVLILDDLHAADQPSLLLLHFLSRELRGARLLMVGTYREMEASQTPAPRQILAEVCREGQRLVLRGLSREDTADYLQRAYPGAAEPSLVEALYSRTEGNPLFLTEAVRLVDRDARQAQRQVVRVPEHVRAVIRQRIALLPDAARDVLTVAAVIGREIELPVLESVLGPQAFAARPALEQAAGLGIVKPVPQTLSRWSFSHVLLRDTLYEDLPAAERAEWHRRIGASLETFYAGDLSSHLAEVAHHFVLGADAESSDAALDYTERAGRRAQALLAYEEAVSHFQRALQVLDLRRNVARPGDVRRRVELQLALGDALWGVRDLAGMRAACALAAETARTLPRDEAARYVAEAALGFGGRQQRAHVVFEQPVVDLLEEALRLLPEEDGPLRARVTARLAYALYSQPDSYGRRVELCRAAVSMARRIGDPLTLRWVLNDWRWALWGPDTIEERLRIAAELAELAERSGDREMMMNEHAWRLVDLLELGDAAAMEAELDIYKRLAYQLQLPWFLEYVARFSAMRAILHGHFSEAERLSNEAMALAQRVHHEDSLLLYGSQLLGVRIEQGRIAEMDRGLQIMVAQYPAVPVWRSLSAFVHAQQGRLEEARAEIERLAVEEFHDLPRDYLRISCLMYLADACAVVGDRRRAAQLYDLMLPYASRCVVVGFGLMCWGALGRFIGSLAATLERWDEASKHFEAALEINRRLHACPAVAHTQYAYARMLHAAQRDPDRARALAGESAATAAALGMESLAASAARLCTDLAAVPAATVRTAAAAPAAVFQQQGDVWTMGLDGQTVQLKDLLGFTYIAQLLRYPDREFHVLDLVSLVGGATEEAENIDLGGDTGEVLDQRARSAYRQRLRDLQCELVEAEGDNDLGRMTQLRAEIDVLSDELLRASGLGGRARRAGSVAERARVNVSKRIGIALKRIAAHHEELARYLSQAIKTGTFCSYNPDPRRRVQWEL
jgi:tetratricopeptide (TPR) repeat protein